MKLGRGVHYGLAGGGSSRGRRQDLGPIILRQGMQNGS